MNISLHPVGATTRRLAGALVLLTSACGPDRDVSLPSCSTVGAAPSDMVDSTDTLDVVVEIGERTAVDLLLRVNGRDERGVVAFQEDVPESAAAVGATVSIAGRFRVCFSPSPATIVFRSERAPHDRAWVRASTDRPVRAWLRVGPPEEATVSPTLVVEPGASGRIRSDAQEDGT